MRNWQEFLNQTSVIALFNELFVMMGKLNEAENIEREKLREAYMRAFDTLVQSDRNVLAKSILDLDSKSPGEIALLSDIIMRSFRVEFHQDIRETTRWGPQKITY